MVLTNVLIFQGSYLDIKSMKEELYAFQKNKKKSKYYNNKITPFIKKFMIHEEIECNYVYQLNVTFDYTKTNLKELIDTFQSAQLETAHMCSNEKREIWIVNKPEYIKEFHLIPTFAINQILLDYMHYKESSIILDSFETIKYDRNDHQIMVNEKKLTPDELIDLLFNKTIKGIQFFEILDQFINNFHEKCINNYEDIYSIHKEHISNEEPSPFGLFIVTFGILAILFILLKVMHYI